MLRMMLPSFLFLLPIAMSLVGAHRLVAPPRAPAMRPYRLPPARDVNPMWRSGLPLA